MDWLSGRGTRTSATGDYTSGAAVSEVAGAGGLSSALLGAYPGVWTFRRAARGPARPPGDAPGEPASCTLTAPNRGAGRVPTGPRPGPYDGAVVNFLLQNVGPVALQFVSEAVRNRPVGDPETAPRPDHAPDGCPMCQVHADLAESERLFAAMTVTADAAGKVPGHMAATVALVEQHLRLASGKLEAIGAARPELAERAQELRTQLDQARAALPERGDINLATATANRQSLEACWLASVRLSDAYFAPPPPTALDTVRQVVQGLPADERRRFIASLES